MKWKCKMGSGGDALMLLLGLSLGLLAFTETQIVKLSRPMGFILAPQTPPRGGTARKKIVSVSL